MFLTFVVNYKGFNKSIRNFSDILHNLNSANEQVTKLSSDISSCQELLASRSDDLAQLYSTYLQHSEFLKILNLVYVYTAMHNNYYYYIVFINLLRCFIIWFLRCFFRCFVFVGALFLFFYF